MKPPDPWGSEQGDVNEEHARGDRSQSSLRVSRSSVPRRRLRRLRTGTALRPGTTAPATSRRPVTSTSPSSTAMGTASAASADTWSMARQRHMLCPRGRPDMRQRRTWDGSGGLAVALGIGAAVTVGCAGVASAGDRLVFGVSHRSWRSPRGGESTQPQAGTVARTDGQSIGCRCDTRRRSCGSGPGHRPPPGRQGGRCDRQGDG